MNYYCEDPKSSNAELFLYSGLVEKKLNRITAALLLRDAWGFFDYEKSCSTLG